MTFSFHCGRAANVLKGQLGVLVAALSIMSSECLAQQGSAEELKALSLEELLSIEVTTVSRRPEKISEVASALQIVTREDILRSGATSLPEALRLASNLQVSQLNSSQWIISARGFNALFSNKLLVMIDGRTVYSPLFAGVYWDVQNVMLEDVERIEVISGPGGTIWGANAVNGVINIITRNSAASQGFYGNVKTGTFLRRQVQARYGGNLGSNASYRVYGMHSNRDHTFTNEGEDHADAWHLTQGGLSINWTPSSVDDIVVHANVYDGVQRHVPDESTVDGQNALARWNRQLSESSDLTLQLYYDRTWRRDIPSTFSDQTQTWDFELDHRFKVGTRHNLIWGAGYRWINSYTENSTEFVGFVPRVRDMNLYSAYVQDEISLAEDRWRLILGTKLQHNVYTGLEIQPTARLAWVKSRSTFWGGVSRAVRTPSRIDVDYHIPTYPVPPHLPSVAGGPNFTSEEVVAYEMGYRIQAGNKSLISIAAFYNDYDDLYSVDSLENTFTYQIQNGTEGTSHGLEVAGRVEVGKNWKLRAGYTYFHKDLRNKPGHIFDYSTLGNDAENRFTLHSTLDLPANLQFDVTFRYVDPLPQPHITDYQTFDARVAWRVKKIQASIVGQNLWEDRHREFLFQIPRSIYGSLTCRL